MSDLLDTPLPCEIVCGHVRFSRGIKLRTFVEAATRWLAAAQVAPVQLPPLIGEDDWLWVAQCLGHVEFGRSEEGRHRMAKIIARIIELRVADNRREGGG